MSKGRSSASPHLNVRNRRRSNVILEASPSAEIASYDYETTLSEPELEKSRVDVNEAGSYAVQDNDSSGNRDPIATGSQGKGCIEKTVYFSTDNQTPVKLISTQEVSESFDREEINRKEFPACEIIVSKSDDGEGSSDLNYTIDDSKKLAQNPVTLSSNEKKGGRASGPRRDRKACYSRRLETCSKSLAKKTLDNSSLLNSKKSSKIPRATALIDSGIAVVPQGENSKTTNLSHQEFLSTRNKCGNFVAESNHLPLPKTCSHNLKENKTSRSSIAALKPKGSKASRISLRNESCAATKTDEKLSNELTITRIGSAGDHFSHSSKVSDRKNLRLDNTCRSCNDQRETVNLQLRICEVRDPWSDSKSSPEIGRSNGWSKNLKMDRYADSTSEDIDISSDYSSDSIRPRKKKCLEEKSRERNPVPKSGDTRNPPHRRARNEARFSLLDTLFDIVFWPFIFLRTNR